MNFLLYRAEKSEAFKPSESKFWELLEKQLAIYNVNLSNFSLYPTVWDVDTFHTNLLKISKILTGLKGDDKTVRIVCSIDDLVECVDFSQKNQGDILRKFIYSLAITKDLYNKTKVLERELFKGVSIEIDDDSLIEQYYIRPNATIAVTGKDITGFTTIELRITEKGIKRKSGISGIYGSSREAITKTVDPKYIQTVGVASGAEIFPFETGSALVALRYYQKYKAFTS